MACAVNARTVAAAAPTSGRQASSRSTTPDLPTARTCVLVGGAGVHGRLGAEPTWGPPGRAALGRLTATAHR